MAAVEVQWMPKFDFNISTLWYSKQGNTKNLLEAAYAGDCGLVKEKMLERGCDINETDSLSSMTALHHAARAGHAEIVKILAAEDTCDVNARDAWKGSALHNACAEGHIEVARALLEREDLKLFLKNRFGQMPIDLAVKYDHLEMVQFLRRHVQQNLEQA